MPELVRASHTWNSPEPSPSAVKNLRTLALHHLSLRRLSRDYIPAPPIKGFVVGPALNSPSSQERSLALLPHLPYLDSLPPPYTTFFCCSLVHHQLPSTGTIACSPYTPAQAISTTARILNTSTKVSGAVFDADFSFPTPTRLVLQLNSKKTERTTTRRICTRSFTRYSPYRRQSI